MNELCHSEFWNWNTTWSTDNPDFTPCFQQTVLVWIPCVILFLGIPLDLYNAHKSRYCNIAWGTLNIIRVCISVALIGITAISLLTTRDFLQIVTLIVQFLAFISSGVMGILNRRRGIVSSGVQFLFWTTLSILAIPQFRTEIKIILTTNDTANTTEPQWKSISSIVYFGLITLQAILQCFADKPPKSSQHLGECRPIVLNEEFKSSFLRKIFFAWFEPLAWKGYRKPLTENNLDPLDTDHSSELLAKQFQKGWQRSVHMLYSSLTNKESSRRSYDFSKSAASKKRIISIVPILVREFSSPLWCSGVIKVFMEALNFSRPFILGRLIRFTSNNEPMWHGVFYMFLLFFVTILMGLLNGQFYQKSFLMGFRIKSALIGAIYRKSLTISMAAHPDVTSGQIVNLMSVDAQRFFDIASYLHVIWSAPIITCIAIYFLWKLLGVSAFVGLLIFVLLIPFNSYVSSKVKLWQGRRMKVADERVKMISEIINGIKFLKLYAWETSFSKFINDIRENELKIIKHASMISICNNISTSMAPYIVTLATFATFVLIDNENVLTPEIVFVSLTLFNIMRQPMIFFPMAILQIMQSYVGIQRINKFLNRDDIAKNNVNHDDNGINAIRIQNGSFSWYDGEAKIKNINLKLKTHSLVAIVGAVGSGKSTLLSSILGETLKLNGSVNTCGSIAYVSQQAWIQNATLKQNILFGKPMNNSFYNQVIDACALREDIQFLPAGDQTEIGERGINLSGGQKQRVALARAIYSKSRIYLFDDPLSAVDTHVGQHLFENIIGPKGLLQNATRLLVTHNITYLPSVSMVHVMTDGCITESGTFRQLINKKGPFARFVKTYIEQITDNEEAKKVKKMVRGLSTVKEECDEIISFIESSKSEQVKTPSTKKALVIPVPRTKEKVKRHCGALIKKEESRTGSVDIGVYKRYFQSVGSQITVIILLASILCQAFSVYGNIWLAEWSANSDSQMSDVRDMYLGVYGGIGVAQALVTIIMFLALIYGCLNASRDIHNNLLEQTFNLPISFFETTPQGRILNKFSKDMNMIDSHVPKSIKLLIGTLFSVVSLLIIISISTPKFMFVIIPLGLMYFTIQSFFIATSRQLRRIMSVARAPVYSHVCETISGQSTIRAFKVQQRFIEESDARVDFNQRCTYPAVVGNRWLALRLDIIGSLVVFFASLFSVLGRDTLTGAIVGLSISYALQVTSSLNFLTRNSCDMEMNIVANERLEEYNEVKKEVESNETAEDSDWPKRGDITFDNYAVRYRDNLDLVLNGISFTVKGGEKIGIVGRTGAGKTSLSLGLFRILEAATGRIFIDDVDISKLNLQYLRSRLTIIPQEPFMFSGTIRMNVDPLGKASDDTIWTALDQSSMKEFVKNLPKGLDTVITEGGNNLSVGQRQLICLARALLRKTKILILDEATASIDLETNDFVQKTISLQFQDCTVLTIAHRLRTIMNSDKILVLDHGKIVEYDSPSVLLGNEEGVFYGMALSEELILNE